jgi:hypothetical protein
MRIDYIHFNKHDIQQIIEKKVESNRKRLPHWLLTLCVQMMSSDDPNDSAAVKVHYANERQYGATLAIYPCFFTASDREQESIIRHEFIHICHSPVLHYIETELFSHIEDNAVKKLLEVEYNKRVEQFTETMRDVMERNS